MRILGVDPGIATVGYGVVEYEGNKFLASDYGAILTPAHTPLEDRLEQVYDELAKLIVYYKAEAMSVEELFFNTNTKTAIQVAQARGVILLSGVKAKIPTLDVYKRQAHECYFVDIHLRGTSFQCNLLIFPFLR